MPLKTSCIWERNCDQILSQPSFKPYPHLNWNEECVRPCFLMKVLTVDCAAILLSCYIITNCVHTMIFHFYSFRPKISICINLINTSHVFFFCTILWRQLVRFYQFCEFDIQLIRVFQFCEFDIQLIRVFQFCEFDI